MTKLVKVAIIDDEQHMRDSMSQWLSLSGFDPEVFESAQDALSNINSDYPGVIVSDIRMPHMDGMQLLKRLKMIDSTLPVILITGHGDVPMAVEAMRMGAYDFLEKPFDPKHMSERVMKAAHNRRMALDSRALRDELSKGSALIERLIGSSEAMKSLKEDILDFGQADEHVLIEGETGTGKTVVAHALHASGSHSARAFVLVSCAAFDEERLMERLFGGDDVSTELPAFVAARGGTLVLEDIETLSERVQLRLLTQLNQQNTDHCVRVISICNLQTPGQTCENLLRPDLFYRLAGLRLEAAPLRNRSEDILPIFTCYCERFSEEYGCDIPSISAQDAAQLSQAPWPGNIRQLRHVAERAVLQSRREKGSLLSLLMPKDVEHEPAVTTEGKPLKALVENFERMLIDNTMRHHKGSIRAVMEELSLPRRTLNEKMTKYNLQRSDYT